MAISNNLRTYAQQPTNQTFMQQQQPTTRTNPYGGTPQGQTFGQGMTYNPNQYSTSQGMGNTRQWNQQMLNNSRGGGGSQTRPGSTYRPDPLPGTYNPSKDGSTQQPYYNPTYQQYTPSGQGQPAQANQFSYYQGLDPTTLQSNDEREAALQAVQANVPIWQLGQNAYQYSQDFNEAQRRWNEQFGYQQGLDQYNMHLSGRQQTMAEWQAEQAASQWAQDYNRQSGLDAWNQRFSQQQFGLQDYAQREQLRQSAAQNAQQAAYQTGQLGIGNRELDIRDQYQQGQLGIGNRELDIRNQYQMGQLDQGNRQLDITDANNRGQLALGNRQSDIQQQLGLGNLDVQRQQNAINEAYNQGRLSNEQRQLALAEVTQQQTFHIQNSQQDIARGQLGVQQGQLGVQQGQLGVAQQANQIDQMYKSGQLDLGQRNAALAELTQQQTYGLQAAQLSQAQQEQARRFSLDFDTQRALEQYRQQELGQQRELAFAQMQAQQQQALLAATGRNQRANTRWMRAT